MISCLVATKEGKWGAYAATNEQLEKKEQPSYLAPYNQPSLVWNTLDAMCPEGEPNEYTDYGTFWQKVRDAGIEVLEPEKMPHRQWVKPVLSDHEE